MNGVISWNPVVIGVIAVIPASFFRGDWCYSSRSRENDLLQNQVKLSENRDFLPKMGFKNQNFRVIGVIVPPLPRHFRVIGVIAVILAKMTFCKID